jgi:type IV pilus assembly protein PilW
MSKPRVSVYLRNSGLRRKQSGLSLIELMVALVISSIVMLGLVTLVNSIGIANRTQDGLARLQENGRFAMQRIAGDLRAAASQHCSNFGNGGSVMAAGGATYVDPPRYPQVYFDAGPAAGILMGVPGKTAIYGLNTRLMMMGHECSDTACAPAINAANRGTDRLSVSGPLPTAMGTTANQRTRGADILTFRYLSGEGARVASQPAAGGPITLANTTAADLARLASAGFGSMLANDPVWVSDCTKSAIFRGVLTGGNVLTLSGAPSNFATAVAQGEPRLQLRQGVLDQKLPVAAFHMPTAFRTVTYYLQVKNDPKQAGRRISSLWRRENGTAQELVEGVERFDVMYGVYSGDGRVRFMNATEVDGLTGVGCSVDASEPGCGWRSVQSVEVYMLVNTVDDVVVGGDDEYRYSWLNDGSANAAGTFENPANSATLRNGLPPGRMLRREFRTLVSLRGNNF